MRGFIVLKNINMNYWVMGGIKRKELTKEQKKESLILKVCKMYDIGIKDLTGKTRLRSVVESRYILFYIFHKVQGMTCLEVGKLFNRDHSTVLYGCETIAGFIEFDKKFEQKISILINEHNYNLN